MRPWPIVLREEGALKNTAILYTSDNGYLLGQHHEVAKVVPYVKSLHVPLVVRLPPQFRGAASTPQNLSSTVGNYQGLRTAGQVYVEYRGVGAPGTVGAGPCEPDNEVEHYNLQADPFELDNIFPAAPGTPEALQEQQLAARVARLSDCAGIRRRDPMSASGHHCE